MDSKINKGKLEDEPEELPSKKAKIVVNAEPEDETMKIIDLNYDCLEHIFEYLHLNDLINVAASNTILQNVAEGVFQREYGDQTLRIMASSRSLYFGDIFDGEDIDVTSFPRFLLIFGDLISSIELNFAEMYDLEDEGMISLEEIHSTFDSIFKHSLKSLVKIEFHEMPNGWLTKFSKLLLKVESVSFTDCVGAHEAGELHSAGDIFPNARSILDDGYDIADIFQLIKNLRNQ